MARVLIIEDCAKTRRLLTRILGVHDHEIVVATNGHEGMSALCAPAARLTPFSLVVTEIFLPQHDGFEMIAAAVRLPRRPKILVIDHPFAPATLVRRPDYLRMALDLGADCALANPVRVRALGGAVTALLTDGAAAAPLRRAG